MRGYLELVPLQRHAGYWSVLPLGGLELHHPFISACLPSLLSLHKTLKKKKNRITFNLITCTVALMLLIFFSGSTPDFCVFEGHLLLGILKNNRLMWKYLRKDCIFPFPFIKILFCLWSQASVGTSHRFSKGCYQSTWQLLCVRISESSVLFLCPTTTQHLLQYVPLGHIHAYVYSTHLRLIFLKAGWKQKIEKWERLQCGNIQF